MFVLFVDIRQVISRKVLSTGEEARRTNIDKRT